MARAPVGMMSLVDGEGVPKRLRIDFVGAQEVQKIEAAPIRRGHHAPGIEPALGRHDAELQTARARGAPLEHRKSVPVGAGRIRGFRHLPVVDNGRVVGVVSLRDFCGAELAEIEDELDFQSIVAEGTARRG